MNDIWLAGFFDGEGCITSSSVYQKGKYEIFPRVYIQISITQKDRNILEKIQNEYGGTIHKDNKNCFHLRITGKKNMKNILLSIYPYSICKKEQIELALEFIETMREENLGCKALSNSIHEDRERIHSGLKLLKVGHQVT
jgi:hypothetical protein